MYESLLYICIRVTTYRYESYYIRVTPYLCKSCCTVRLVSERYCGRPGLFVCAPNVCIEMSKACDGTPDCQNHREEVWCDGDGEEPSMGILSHFSPLFNCFPLNCFSLPLWLFSFTISFHSLIFLGQFFFLDCFP